ncbi:MAG: hypothetical protein H0W99_17720, partial [Acidobacteria bacterium]|nr:hypothetical protein [Acidobacteriota bacterium]
MKESRNPPMRSSAAYSLKLFCLLLFSALFVILMASRLGRTTASAVATTQNMGIAVSHSAPNVNRQPELGEIRFKRVGVGQRIFFGLAVIDEESDDVRVEMVQKPASALYNEKTLTVDWTPRASDGKRGDFSVRLTEYPRAAGQMQRTVLKTFSIAIAPRAVALPTVPLAPLPVETLISITDTDRLAAANAKWPITAVFQRISEIEASKQIKPDNGIQKTSGAALFRDALKNLAILHHNEEIDPDSPRFNRQWNAENWRLIMVRPRVNKKIFELRLVYRNVVAAEPVYLMPRMRITRGKDPDILKDNDWRQKNNRAYAALLHEAFFDGANLKPFVTNDKRSYGEALAAFITKVVTYSDPADPRMQANFAALPHNARLGGDDMLDAQGRYQRGNGWALGVMKIIPVERSGRKELAFNNEVIDGFATSIKAPDGKAYKPVPAPAFVPGSASYIKDFEKLIDGLGFAAIPDEHDGGHGSTIDASSVSRPFKERFMIEETPLRDPRRRLTEERGMTCIQCHVRNFDEGNYLDTKVSDPAQLAQMTMARDIPRLFFVLTPDDGRSEFFRRNEQEQVDNLRGVMRDYLNLNINTEPALTD